LQVESEQDCTVVEEESFDLSVWASRINLKQSFRLWRTVGMRSGGLTSALLLGNRRFLSNLDQFHFRACGISHLLALSGLHVSILVAFLDRLLKLLRASKTVRAVVISLTAIGYLILTGCSVSAARAVLMACILYLAFLWRHEYDSLTALCTALMLILTVTPYAVLDVSLWLSFVAAGSIIIFYPPINRFFNKRRPQNKLLRICTRPLTWPCSAVAVGFLANVALLPLSAAFFGSFSIWSIPATLLFSFPVTLLMIGGTILLVCPYVPFLGEACAALEAFILEGAAFFARQNVTLLPLTDTRTEILLGVLSVALILLAVLKLRHRAWSLLLPLLFVAVTVLSYCAMRFPVKTDWQVTAVLQDHRGEICVYTGGGHVAVVNDTYGAVSCAQEIKKVVDDAGFTEIRDVILCNPSDQATYFIKTLAETVRVRKLYLPYPETPKDMAITEKLCEVAQSYGISVYANADEKLLEYLSPSQ